MDIAKEVRVMLAKENIKVADLARLMNTSHQNLTNILNKNNPTITKIEEMADALGYKVEINFKKRAAE